MIKVFQGRNRHNYAMQADAMFRMRADVFSTRLKWDVKVKDGWEIDDLDEIDPLYVLGLDKGRVVGSFRFLPTTGPTLLSGALSSVFGPNLDIRSPLIWECTRFAIAPDIEVETTRSGICKVTAELMMAGCAIALDAGILQIMGVFDKSMMRIYRRAGWVPEVIAASTNRTQGIAVGIWDVSAEILDKMIETNGFKPSFEDEPAVDVQRAG